MFKNIINQIPVTTIIISYFFICGGLFLIGFWTTFNVDIASLVSIADIPKSFIFPFVVSQGFSLFNMLSNIIIANRFKDSFKNNTPIQKNNKNLFSNFLSNLFSLDYLIFYASTLSIRFYYLYKLYPIFWIITSSVFVILLSFKLSTLKILKAVIPSYFLRIYIVNSIVAIPIFCLATGKSNSLRIYNNNEIKYIRINNDTTHNEKKSLKFVGFLGDKLIVSSLDNKKIIFINQSSFNQVELNDIK